MTRYLLPKLKILDDYPTLKKSMIESADYNLQNTIREHLYNLQERYHHHYHYSGHFSPNGKITSKSSENGFIISINIKGLNRAYQDILLTPKKSKYLAYHISDEAYKFTLGRSASFFSKATNYKLFVPKGLRNGHKRDYLAINQNGRLMVLYKLKKSIFQKKKPDYMPTDDSMLQAIEEGFDNVLYSELGKQ